MVIFFPLRKNPCRMMDIMLLLYIAYKKTIQLENTLRTNEYIIIFFCILASSTSVYLTKKLSHFLRCVMLRYLSLFWHRKTSELHCLTQYSHLLLICSKVMCYGLYMAGLESVRKKTLRLISSGSNNAAIILSMILQVLSTFSVGDP